MNNSLSLYDVYQYIIIGCEMIGKTSIINRYFDVFFSDLARTLAIDYKSKRIKEDENNCCIIRIWVTECILLCFSICNRESFNKLVYEKI